jgi:hypothetical protein
MKLALAGTSAALAAPAIGRRPKGFASPTDFTIEGASLAGSARMVRDYAGETQRDCFDDPRSFSTRAELQENQTS